MRHLIALRKQFPEFSSDHPAEILDADNDHVFAYLRYNVVHRTLVLVNISDVTQAATPLLFEYAGMDLDTPDTVSGETVRVEGDRVVLSPYQFHWFRNSCG